MDGGPGHMERFRDGMGPYGRGGWEHGGGHHWLAIVVFALLLVALVLLVLLLARSVLAGRQPLQPAAGGGGAPAPDEALGLLRLRYAKGEIGRDDFLRTLADLGGELPSAGSAG